MSLMTKIAKNIEVSVLEFTRLIAEKYDLEQDTLMEMWTDVTKMKTKASKAKKSPSAYQVFSTEQRALIKEEEPTMAFGDVAKEIGKRWRKLSSEEKASYAKAESAVKTSPKKKDKKKAITPVSSGSETDLHSLSKQRLLEMCAAKGVKIAKSKNKDQIIAAIQEADEADALSEENASVAVSEPDASAVMSVEASESGDDMSVDAIDNTLEEEEEEQSDMQTMYQAMKIKDLAEICKEKNLPSKGTKEILIGRLLAVA